MTAEGRTRAVIHDKALAKFKDRIRETVRFNRSVSLNYAMPMKMFTQQRGLVLL